MRKNGKTAGFVCCAVAMAALGTGACLLALEAAAETTYRITDGSRVLIHTTDAREAETVLEEAGITLSELDTYVIEPEEETILVCRGKRVVVEHHGQRIETVSYGEPVWQLLERLEIDWGERDRISAPLDAQVYDGMVLKVELETYEIRGSTAVLPYETTFCLDPNMPAGEQRVLTQGRNGRLCRKELVICVNGRETGREILEETVTVQPIQGVVAVGTGQLVAAPEESSLPVIGNGLIILPTGDVLTYRNEITSLATAYCDKGKTATGTQARVGAIAVDPRYIPYGTRMFIVSVDGEYIYGIATAEDCGNKEFIHDTRIDLHFDTYDECRRFGARWCKVYFLG